MERLTEWIEEMADGEISGEDQRADTDDESANAEAG